MPNQKPAFSALLKSSVKFGGGGGTSAFGRLLRYYVEILSAAFNVLRKYRQYYFSRPYLKSLLFDLTNKKQEAQQLKKHVFNACAEPLKNAKENLKDSYSSYSKFKKVYKKIALLNQAWVNSKEFNDKYIKTNHPFPPLLNPKTLEDKNSPFHYSKIPADLAWDLNFPLPKTYKFLCVMASFNAHTSMVNYLKKSGVSIAKDHMGDARLHYIFDYNEALKSSPLAINITAYSGPNEYYKNLKKLILMIDNKEIPILWIVKCPFKRLLSACNNSWGKPDVIYDFNENTPLLNLENRKSYWVDKDLSLSERIQKIVEFNTFSYASLYDFFDKNGFKNHAFLDLQDYQNPQDIFVLFNQLSKTYDFNPPKDKNDFTHKYSSLYSGILPLSYTINNIKFTMTHENSNGIEVSEILGIEKNNYTKDIFVYVPAENLEKIKEEKFKEKIQNFMNKLAEILEFEIKNNRMNQESLMNFLQNNSDCRNFLRKVFKDETEFVNKYRHDIVSSWKYYLEFEKMCVKLDADE